MKPSWLKRTLPSGPEYNAVKRLIEHGNLHTVCQEANCPNRWECFSKKTATFLILGDLCTRNCRFCNVRHGAPLPPDPGEPRRVAEAAKTLGLLYAVVTSVTRDDLPDGGADQFAAVIHALKETLPGMRVEVLIPDLQGNWDSLNIILAAQPDVLNHNIETVPRLYPPVRAARGPHAADYQRSLALLAEAKRQAPTIPTKSGLMVGLGETNEELLQTLRDLRAAGCSILTVGQYLQPTAEHLPVERYVTPEEFETLRQAALEMGFSEAACGPFVRSSYHASETFEQATQKR
ncbi:TPA: lipoyl synthase [Candidatus Sumerlaeota bacterium]|jgi:lipoyl synthase|nr:lipoyl synthase [Candidatus Sumerlaeota bacterium]